MVHRLNQCAWLGVHDDGEAEGNGTGAALQGASGRTLYTLMCILSFFTGFSGTSWF